MSSTPCLIKHPLPDETCINQTGVPKPPFAYAGMETQHSSTDNIYASFWVPCHFGIRAFRSRLLQPREISVLILIYKVIRNSNETEQFLNFQLFYNCQLEIMLFIHSFDNMFLFSYHNVTHINVSKQYNENRGVRALLTIRKHQINLPPSSNFHPKMIPVTGTVPLTYFMGYGQSIL